MFNAPGYASASNPSSSRGGSPVMMAATSRWVTAEPVGYAMGLPPGGSSGRLEHRHQQHQSTATSAHQHRASYRGSGNGQQQAMPPTMDGKASTTSSFVLSAGDIRVGGSSPLPSRPPGAVLAETHHHNHRRQQQQQQPDAPETPSGRPTTTGRQRHHATQQQHHDSNDGGDMVSTPHASTIGRAPPQQHRMLSPAANDVSEGIADRLAGLWTEYVGGGGGARRDDDNFGGADHQSHPAGYHRSGGHAGVYRDDAAVGVDSSSSSQWHHSRHATPTSEAWSMAVPQQQDPQPSYHHEPAMYRQPPPKKWVYRHVLTPSGHGILRDGEGRPPPSGGPSSSQPTAPPLGGSRWDRDAAGGASMHGRSGGDAWTLPPGGASLRSGDGGGVDDVPLFQSLPNPSMTSMASYHYHNYPPHASIYSERGGTGGSYPSAALATGTAPPHGRSSSRGASVFSSSTTLPSHSASTAATYSIVLLEAYRVLEERERTQRDHVRFLETQGRKGMVAREGLERPYNLEPPLHAAATTPTVGGPEHNKKQAHYHLAVVSPSADLMGGPGEDPGYGVSTTSMRLAGTTRRQYTNINNNVEAVGTYGSSSADDGNRTGYNSYEQQQRPLLRNGDDDPRRLALLVTSDAPLRAQQHWGAAGRWSPPRADGLASPFGGAGSSYAYERCARVSEEEALNRRELAAAEAEVREAVCSVIRSMQHHADAVAVRHAIHRALLIAIAEEQEARKKIDGLEAHIASAIRQLFRDATASLVSTIYERVSLMSRVHMALQREEAKGRLDVVDEEIIRRRETLVKIHEAELLLCQRNAKRLSDASKSLQRVFNEETELRFGLLQEEDYMRNDRYARWAHEKNVLEHLERQRMTTARSTHSKLLNVVEQELHARGELMEMEQRLATTMRAYVASITERHHHLQQALYERERREGHRQECHRQIALLEEREGTLRQEMSMAWSCVVAALEEWQGEMVLQHELEAQFQRRRSALARLHQLEEIEASARIAVLYAEEAVHTQHMAWAREVVVSIKEEKATAVARRMHALCEQEAFVRSRIVDEEDHALVIRQAAEGRCRHLIQLAQCDAREAEARAEIVATWHRGAKAMSDAAYTQREAVLDRECQLAFRMQERQTMVDTYQRAEADSRLGLSQVEAAKREALGEQFVRERLWIVTQVDAKRMAMAEALREVEAQEASSRQEGHAVQASRWDDLQADCDASWRRAVEATRAAQRARQHQFRTASLTLSRLEEVNRDVLQGAAARSFQDLEARQSELWHRFKEEHALAVVVLEEQRRRSFHEKRVYTTQREAVARSELMDTEADVRQNLMDQFELRRPMAQSDNPQVVALLASERKDRIDLEDLFTYERWNLVDLEAMARDDIADGVRPTSGGRGLSQSPREYSGGDGVAASVVPPQPASRRTPPSSSRSPPATATTWYNAASETSATNAFADFIEETDAPRAAATPQPPHPTEWEYEDADPPADNLHAAHSSTTASLPPAQLSAPSRPPAPNTHAREALQMMQMARRSTTTPSFAVPSSQGPGSLPVPDMMRSPSSATSSQLASGDRQSPASVSPAPRRVLTVPSLSTRPPPSGGPPSVRRPITTGTTTAIQDHLVADLVQQETDRRKKLAQFQYQLLAQLIQHNIETLPDAN